MLRYDRRGYGRSLPAAGEFSHLGDLIALPHRLQIDEPVTAMGCSMGGGIAMNLALAQPSMAKALMMVDARPSGLEIDVLH